MIPSTFPRRDVSWLDNPPRLKMKSTAAAMYATVAIDSFWLNRSLA